jgi:hypothetical protein
VGCWGELETMVSTDLEESTHEITRVSFLDDFLPDLNVSVEFTVALQCERVRLVVHPNQCDSHTMPLPLKRILSGDCDGFKS